MKTTLMFSGQGSQYPGMGKDLYNNFKICKDVFDEADEALGFPISSLCFDVGEKLNETEFTQPAMLTLSTAIFELVKSLGIHVEFHSGLSLGEYSALVASGSLRFSDAVQLVRKRGRFMSEAVPKNFGAMSAIISLSPELTEQACEEASQEDEYDRVYCANFNMPGQIVIAGSLKAVERAEKICIGFGARKTVRLNVSGPFHTPYLQPAADKLKTELFEIEIGEIKTPVVSNLTAKEIPSCKDVAGILVKQAVSPVKWEQGVRYMLSKGIDTFVELGAGKVLCGFVRKIDKNVKTYNVENVSSFENLVSALF